MAEVLRALQVDISTMKLEDDRDKSTKKSLTGRRLYDSLRGRGFANSRV